MLLVQSGIGGRTAHADPQLALGDYLLIAIDTTLLGGGTSSQPRTRTGEETYGARQVSFSLVMLSKEGHSRAPTPDARPLVQLAIFAIVIAVAALIEGWEGAAIGFGVSCFSALALFWMARR